MTDLQERRAVDRSRRVRPTVISVVWTVGVLFAMVRGLDPAVGAVLLVAPLLVVLVLLHPYLPLYGVAVTVSVVPYMHLTYTEIPLLLVLLCGSWAGVVLGRRPALRVGWLEWVMILLAFTAAISIGSHGWSGAALQEYGAWIAPTVFALPLTYAPFDVLLRFGRILVVGTFIGAVAGIVLRVVDPFGVTLSKLAVVGYHGDGGNAQLVPADSGNILRLTGLYVESNIAGLVLLTGLIFAVALFRGVPRVVLAGVIGTALTLTLSRSAIGTVVVAAFLVLVVSRADRQLKRLIVGSGVLGVFLAFATPIIRARLFESFGPNDTGSTARSQALEQFVTSVDGHWWTGIGWVREEFRESAVAATVNYVANAPLLTIYRGGLVIAIPFVIMLLAAALRSARLLRRGTTTAAVLGAGLIAMVVVALQLDFPVVTQAPATTVLAIFIGFVAHRGFDPEPRTGVPSTQEVGHGG